MLEAEERLESTHWDGAPQGLIATAGHDLIDDLAYLMTFGLNRTFSRSGEQVQRLVLSHGSAQRHRSGTMFPFLFQPQLVIQQPELDRLREIMDQVLALSRENHVRVMRAIRRSVDATRRAVDDPTGAYTDLVAVLESLGDASLSTVVTWDRYDGRKRKIIDRALKGESAELITRVREAVLEADHVGLKRRFVASTLARVTSSFFREEAAAAINPPRGADLERMLSVAYDIRSRRSHVLEDLGAEAWVFTNGSETAPGPGESTILTLAGLWRLVRHVALRFIADAPAEAPEPWEYHRALPGMVSLPMAPQYWVWNPDGLNASTAHQYFNGIAEAFIAWRSGDAGETFPDLSDVVHRIEGLVESVADPEAVLALVAVHRMWHVWAGRGTSLTAAAEFEAAYGAALDRPSPIAFTTIVLAGLGPPKWSADEWFDMASARRAERLVGRHASLPRQIDVLIQSEAAEQMEAAGRHAEALVFAANAMEEAPGHPLLLAWEKRLSAGQHDSSFNVEEFLFGVSE